MQLKTTIINYSLLAVLFLSTACSNDGHPSPNEVPKEVQNVITQSKDNGKELKKAIFYFLEKGDSLQLKALYFLIENMPLHYSENVEWTTSNGDVFPFNELDYPDYETSIKEFKEQTRDFSVTPGIQRYFDQDTITADLLIAHVEFAFSNWQESWAKHFPFNFFCEYILPYRVNTEPIQTWENSYQKRFLDIAKRQHSDDPLIVGAAINSDLKLWFTNSFALKNSKDPVPLLGPLQLLHRKTGGCPDMVNLATYSLRSVGIPAAVDFTPFWATSTGSHFWNFTFDSLRYGYSFMGAGENYYDHSINKDMAKVYRIMYSKQKDHIAARVPAEKIHSDLFQVPNIMDVTKYYIKTTNLSVKLDSTLNHEVIYLCVFNGLQWRPVAAEVADNGEVHFNDIGLNIVYLPMVYNYSKLTPAGLPVLVRDKRPPEFIQCSDKDKRNVVIKNKDRYLILRNGKSYTLRYWDGKWVKHSTQKASSKSFIEFKNVPANSLMVLVPEYSQGKERIFTLNDKDELMYW
jgi:hypothetical protein